MNQEFGKFMLIDKLDEGGMGKVYRAIVKGAAGFEKTVVIKQILPQFCRDNNYIAQFQREALIAANLNHPNIVQIYHFDRVGEQYYIEMEFIDGMDLYKILKKSRQYGLTMPLSVCLEIARQIAQGLEYAYHTRGKDGRPLMLVHRDLDLRNVILTWDGFAKIIDFGLSKAKEELSGLSQVGEFKGKFIYAAPEQFSGLTLDNRTDFYALGVILYTMILGEYPFDAGDVRRLIAAKAEGNYRHPKLVSPDLPMAAANIITTCLEPDPGRRFAEVGDLLEAIEAAETAIPAGYSAREFMRRLRKRSESERPAPPAEAGPARDLAEAETILFEETAGMVIQTNSEISFSEFADKVRFLHPKLASRRRLLEEFIEDCRKRSASAAETAQREAGRIIQDLCAERGMALTTEQPLDEVDRLTENGTLPVDVALALHTIRIIAGKAMQRKQNGGLTPKDAAGLLTRFFEVLRWYYCEFPEGPRLPNLFGGSQDEKLTRVVANLGFDPEKTYGTRALPVERLITPLLVRIPAGPFIMGVRGDDGQAGPEERPGREVSLPEFRLGKFPVTNQEYFTFCRETGRPLPAGATIPNLAESNRPVTGVDFHQAAAFAEWLAAATGKPFRLPREAEWEKAARGGLVIDGEGNPLPDRRFPWGERFRPGIANASGRYGGPTDIHDFPFNRSPYNCYDMAGNVWEWCQDWYDAEAYAKGASSGEAAPAGGEKVLRGGSWYSTERECRCTRRGRRPPTYQSFDVGFRICCDE